MVCVESTDLSVAAAVESQSGDCQERYMELPLTPGAVCTKGSLKRGLEIRIKSQGKMARLPYRKSTANSFPTKNMA